MASEICAYVGKTKPWEFPATFDFTINMPDGGVQMGTYKVTFEKLRQHKTLVGIRFYYTADGVIKATLHK